MGNDMLLLTFRLLNLWYYIFQDFPSAHLFIIIFTVEVLMSGHPQNAKKVSVTKAGCLRGWKNTEFLWELRKIGFCELGDL